MVGRNQIYIGSIETPDYYFENDEILSITGEFEVAVAGKELSIDTLTVEVVYDVEDPKIYKPTDYDGINSSDDYILRGKSTHDIREILYATPLWYYNRGELIGQFYVRNVERNSKRKYTLNCISSIGLLDKMKHYGGMYTGLAFKEVLKDILLPSQSIYRLPFPYQEVEYLESSGVQYIDTGVKASSGMRIETEVEIFDNISDQMFFFGEARDSAEDSYAIGVKANSTDVNYYFGDYTKSVVSGEPKIEKYTRTKLVFNTWYNEEEVTPGYAINDTLYPIYPTYSFASSQYNIYLFGLNSNNLFASGLKGRITVVSIYDADDQLIHCYVPCYLKEDKTVGMYDTIDNVFKMNAGSGAFLAGPEKGVGGTGSVMDYELEENLGEQLVYGWLPVASKRENLYNLLFAYNAVLMKSDQGKPFFTRLFTSTSDTISDDHIYIEGSIDYGSPASRIEVTEHAFVFSAGSVDEQEVFNNTNDGTVAEHQIVYFGGDPIKPETLRTSSSALTLEYANVNCACVSGVGALYGKPYIHTERIIHKDNPAPVEENIVSVSGSTLVNYHNSDYILDRTYNYYAKARIVSNSIVVNGQKCGRKYRLKDPFGNMREAYLEKMSMNASAIIKSGCEFIFDFNPVNSGGIYNNMVILTGEGDWTVPEEVLERGSLLAILIGGGQGGYAGLMGENGSVNNRSDDNAYKGQTIRDNNNGGEGGEGGAGGSAGKVRRVTVTGFGTKIHYNCGKGGRGQDPYFDAAAHAATVFDNTKAYAIGDCVFYEDSLYLCTSGAGSGEFNPLYWGVFVTDRIDNYGEFEPDEHYQAHNTPLKYSAETAYAVGDYCIKNNSFWRCITATAETGEEWDPSKWTAYSYLAPSQGGETSFGNYSTAVGGAIQPNGVLIYTTGDILAISGENGVAGGKGGDWSIEGGYATYGQPVSYKGITYNGGKKGNHSYIEYANFDGGRGSGAVVGSNGVNGDSAEVVVTEEREVEGEKFIDADLMHLGYGGDAPIPIPAEAAKKYGRGGNGGHGGAGGGADGDGAESSDDIIEVYENVASSWRWGDRGGCGSRGSAGSAGADGCVVLYY